MLAGNRGRKLDEHPLRRRTEMAEGNLISGTGTAAAGTGKSELTVTSKDGKQIISGTGRDSGGPYNFQLTKQ